MSDQLETRLHDLAESIRVDVPSGLEQAVLARLARQPVRPRRLRRWLLGLFVALLGVGAVASPVGAGIREWLFHGVAIEQGEPPVAGEPTVPAEPAGMTLEQAASLAGFTPVVPAELGPPDGVGVSADRLVVSLTWGSGADAVRLDQFRGEIEPTFWKRVDVARIVTLASTDALWLPTPHHVSVVEVDGSRRRLESRLAAPTLVWQRDDLTLRLEGDLTLARLVEIADSVG